LIPASAQSTLYKWIAILTGSKNALKGAAFNWVATLTIVPAIIALGLINGVNAQWHVAAAVSWRL